MFFRTAVIRLRSQHDKLCQELDLETELEAKIREKLKQAVCVFFV